VPRAGLTPEVVGAEAARLADEVGYDRITLAAIADRFGVAVPSLYKHVDGLGGLQHSVSVLAVRELGAALDAAIGIATGDDALRLLADAYRNYARAHPGRYAATIRAPDPDDGELKAASDAVLEVVFRVLSGYGLAGNDAIDATRALRAALHGFISLEAAGGFGMPRDVDRSYDRLIEALAAALRNWNSNSNPL
jgi:AcrR family transcriptional regulator